MKPKGCASWIIGFAALLAVVFGLDFIGSRIDRARFPWGYDAPGKSTLAGTWVGVVTTGGGQRLGMLIDMRLAPLGYHRRRSAPIIRTQRMTWLIGRVLTCTGTGRPNEFVLDGKPDDDGASRFHLSMHPRVDSLNADGLAPSHMKGRWSGGETIDLEISLHLHRGKSSITNSADPDTGHDQQATLGRGTAARFGSICQSLAR
jgi:hypothetical protein